MSYGLNLIVIWLPGHLGECELELLYSFAATLVLVAVPRTLCKSDWDNGLGAWERIPMKKLNKELKNPQQYQTMERYNPPVNNF